MTTVTILDDPDKVIETLGTFRREVLAALDEPDSATGIARKLDSTRQKVNYHLGALESAGLVETAERRPRRGLTERIMRRTADVVLVDPTAFDSSGLTRPDAVGLSGVVSTAIDLIGHAAAVASQASEEEGRVAAATLDTTVRLATPQALRSMLDEIALVIARHDSDEGLAVRVSTAILPDTR